MIWAGDAATPQRDVAAATMAVFEEAVALHLRLTAAAEALHGSTELTRACRGVLRDLAVLGPRTVAQLARLRPVSRQTIQVQVNQLLEAGMAELLDNPDHARSRLVALTPAGKTAVEEMWAEEARMVEALPVSASPQQLFQTAQTLRDLRLLLEHVPPGRRVRRR
jgi:DNA-binding MarR family transcriptional regulator